MYPVNLLYVVFIPHLQILVISAGCTGGVDPTCLFPSRSAPNVQVVSAMTSLNSFDTVIFIISPYLPPLVEVSWLVPIFIMFWAWASWPRARTPIPYVVMLYRVSDLTVPTGLPGIRYGRQLRQLLWAYSRRRMTVTRLRKAWLPLL